jgi:hypothetical protein
MNARSQFLGEDRDTALINETRAQFSTLTRAVLAGEPVATKRMADALGEYVADTHAAGHLVRAVLTDQHAALKVITDLIWAEAGELAEAEVAQKERARAESVEDARIEAATWLRRFV